MGIYMEAFQHIVWATRKREHFIHGEIETILHKYIRQRCREMRVQIYALNGMPDHTHIVVTLPATLATSDFMKGIKGGSAHYINHLPESNSCLYWQEGYGLLTFAFGDLPRVVRYVDQQKQHHATGRLSPKMERAADWEDLSQSREAGLSGVLAD